MNIALFVYDVYRPLLLNFLISQQKIYKCCQKAFDPAMKRHLYRTSHIYIYTFLYIIFAIFFFFVNIILYRVLTQHITRASLVIYKFAVVTSILWKYT